MHNLSILMSDASALFRQYAFDDSKPGLLLTDDHCSPCSRTTTKLCRDRITSEYPVGAKKKVDRDWLHQIRWPMSLIDYAWTNGRLIHNTSFCDDQR